MVRFHHVDPNWGTLRLIDYGQNDSRRLNVAMLARFDRFVAELKAAGLSLNLNLLTARDFQARDGLPAAVDSMDWRVAHLLGFYNDHHRAGGNAERGMMTTTGSMTMLPYDPWFGFTIPSPPC